MDQWVFDVYVWVEGGWGNSFVGGGREVGGNLVKVIEQSRGFKVCVGEGFYGILCFLYGCIFYCFVIVYFVVCFLFENDGRGLVLVLLYFQYIGNIKYLLCDKFYEEVGVIFIFFMKRQLFFL